MNNVEAVKLLGILVRVKELRMSNELTKEMFPEAVIGDLWIEAVDQLLSSFGLSESDRNLFWTITEP